MLASSKGGATRRLLTTALVLGLVAAACTGDDDETSPTSRGTDASSSTSGTDSDVVAGEAFPEDRCAANREAGTITYLSGFDFAAAASIVEVLVAADKGYFEQMCLDVELTPNFSARNYQPVAAGQAQFASGGSFSEVLSYATQNEAGLVALAVDGRDPIDVLMVKPGEAEQLEDLEGTTLGVKEKLQPSIGAMLAGAGLEEGSDYETVPLEGFDPLLHIEIRDIDGFSGWRSNEPGQLERADVEFDTFDPMEHDVPGSFGAIFSSAEFVNEHPTAAQDFMRAAMKGLEDAIADPDAATDVAIEMINGHGNPNFLAPEGERFRWRTEAELVAGTPELPAGVIDPELLQAEVDAYAEVGMFGDETPEIEGSYVDVLSDVYADDGSVNWPST